MNDSPLQPELQVGGAVPQDKVYIVRHTDDELFQALDKGEYCNVVCPRQMGKTSVIHRIQIRLRNKGCRTALFDIRGRLSKAANADDWYLGLLHEFSSRFQLGCNVREWWETRLEPTPNQKLLNFFQEQMIARFSERFIVFLDEIDSTIELPYTDDFFVAIRSLYNDRVAEPELKRLTFCLVGVFSPNELVKDRRTTAYNIGRSFELEDFDPTRDNLKQLALTLSSDPSRGDELLNAILAWTGGQPYLTVSACQKVVDAGIGTPEEVDKLIEDVFLTYEKTSEHSDDTHFEYISSFLGQRVTARIETAELYRRILQGHTEHESSTPAVAALKLSGLVKADRNGRLVVRNEIYRRRFSADWAMAVLSLAQPVTNIPVTTGRDSGLQNPELRMQGRGSISEQFHQAPSLVPEPTRISASRLFISHSSQDSALVYELRAALADHGHDLWVDSREVRGGDLLWAEVERAIENASAFAVVVSPDALQSKWVGRELRHALALQEKRGKELFPIILLSLNGIKLGVLEYFFGDEPIYIPIVTDVGGIEAGVNAILVALGKLLPADVPAFAQPKAEPLEELVLELTDLKFHEQDGKRRAFARARLVYEPATPGLGRVESVQGWPLIAPIGPIEAEELRWYLEKYAIWPSHYFRDRARKIEASLVQWGQVLYNAAMPVVQTANIMKAWSSISEHAGRRFSIYVNSELDMGASDAEVKSAKEAAALILALPWELLHDGNNYLFQGAKPVRVRRRLPNTRVLEVPVVSTPVRILLVAARPEDDSCGYIDHRASALPLVEAMESLPGLVKIHMLSPPTLPALRTELDRARNEKTPYHVVHFDGHGAFTHVGLGGLCFENPEDTSKLENRRHVTVFADELGPLLRQHRIPLVFLEACQTAQAEKASESIASELLKVGVASVVAMSHSVLVETSRRFAEAFYEALTDGKRVGDAVLAGQRALKDDTFRGRIFGAGELRLEDWFVPVLYQEKDDPQLFKITPAKQTQEDFPMVLARRLGDLPPEPETGFIGRSRELLALQRLLREGRYAVVRGQGGEGKTALAAELARWMVRSQQMHRAAFVSVESHGNVRAVVDTLGKQLVQRDFSAAGDLEEAIHQLERALREQPALLVIDKMESVLLPPFMKEETPEALSQEAAEELKAILAVCERLLKAGDTRVIFTSREALPAPFDGAWPQRELHQLNREDAVKLVERVLNAGGSDAGASSDVAREEIEQLVDAVHCHARTLALLAPSLLENGVEATRESLVELMAEMDKNFPGSREKSVFASVELSLRRMSQENRDRARVLGVFHGAADLDVIHVMMKWEQAEVASLAAELIETGLATPDRYAHVTLNPALCPYLRILLDEEERDTLTARWVVAMHNYVRYLERQQSQNAEIVSTLTMLELPNLFALLDLVQREANAEATIDLASSLYALLQSLGKPRLLERVAQVRDAASSALGETWNHAQFSAARNRVEQQLAGGRLYEALDGAQLLLRNAQTHGEQAYANADLDVAIASLLLARVLKSAGGAERALPLLEEAQQRFEAIAVARSDSQAERMVSVCFAERGNCLLSLGRLDEAVTAYEETIRRAEELGDERMVAVTKSQLGSVRLEQQRYKEALDLLLEARERFTKLGEPVTVAGIWHQTGLVYQAVGQPEAAEDAYRKSLAIDVQIGSVAAQAATLGQLGNLYGNVLGRQEEAVAFFRQAVDKYTEIGNVDGEGRTRLNLAIVLRELRRLDEARQEIHRAIKCKAQFGHAGSIWNAWAVLADIEEDAGNSDASADATRKAIDSYLSYRRDGGQNYDAEGRISEAVIQSMFAGDQATAESLIQQLAADSNLPSNAQTFIHAIQAIVAGSRDRTLADAPDLYYGMAAEILFLIETLENPPSVNVPASVEQIQVKANAFDSKSRENKLSKEKSLVDQKLV